MTKHSCRYQSFGLKLISIRSYVPFVRLCMRMCGHICDIALHHMHGLMCELISVTCVTDCPPSCHVLSCACHVPVMCSSPLACHVPVTCSSLLACHVPVMCSMCITALHLPVMCLSCATLHMPVVCLSCACHVHLTYLSHAVF